MTSERGRAAGRVHLHDVIDPDLFAEEHGAGMIRPQVHPELELTVWNYTAAATYERRWNPATLTCRGLIVDGDGHIVARPWPKFFNLVEHAPSTLPTGEPIQVLEKLDGSLGILYPTGPGHHAVATRGSFASDQALHATQVWRDRYAETASLDPSLTYLVEIIYPQNRIVVDYADTDDLVLLGAVETTSGRSVDVADVPGWPGPRVGIFGHSNLASVLEAPARNNAEGVVVWFRESDLRVKIKQEDYLRVHRLVTNVSERRIWEALSSGERIDHWLEAVPDEFYDFVRNTAGRMRQNHAALLAGSRRRFEELVAGLTEGWSRRDFAAAVARLDSAVHWQMFAHLDNKPVDARLWAELRPAEHVPLFARRSDED